MFTSEKTKCLRKYDEIHRSSRRSISQFVSENARYERAGSNVATVEKHSRDDRLERVRQKGPLFSAAGLFLALADTDKLTKTDLPR
jgi:hypothetical protein